MERKLQINWPLLVEEAVRRRRQMNLTQKQVASLAKMSTPTVSRFEQAEKDLQLSSVLAILDVLGMTDKRTLVFPDREFRPDARHAIVRWGEDGEARIRCRVAPEALDDPLSVPNRL